VSNPVTTQIAKTPDKAANLKTLLMKALPSIQGIASKQMQPERLVRIALVAASRRPELLNCTPYSILSALLQAAEVGLEPETPLQHAYLVPFKNKNTGTMEAVFMPSARGLACIAKRQGELVAIRARIVYENEFFDMDEGLEPRLVHKPMLDGDTRGDMIAAYAVAVMKDGSKEFDVMSRKDIEKVRASSRASSSGPWVDWYEMMCRKTVLKRLLRQLPIENEQLGKAVEADDSLDSTTGTAMVRASGDADVIPMMANDVEEVTTRAEQTAAVIRDRKAKQKRDAEATAPVTAPSAQAPPVPPSTPAMDEAREIEREERETAKREQARDRGTLPGMDNDD
jgi:recombination protein RecT